MSDGKKGRRRRSSSLIIYQEPLESPEHMSDQSALPNLNATWVNSKGKSRDFGSILHTTTPEGWLRSLVLIIACIHQSSIAL